MDKSIMLVSHCPKIDQMATGIYIITLHIRGGIEAAGDTILLGATYIGTTLAFSIFFVTFLNKSLFLVFRQRQRLSAPSGSRLLSLRSRRTHNPIPIQLNVYMHG